MERIEHHASFGGRQEVWKHTSATLGSDAKFGIFLPETVLRGERRPVLYWLSGLTCTEQNFVTKAGAQEHAARHGLIVVAPDTSPRGVGVADDPGYDLGQGAGFYLDATQQPWAAHYRMQEYVAEELPALVEQHFAALDERGIFGHSMGGHGALVTAGDGRAPDTTCVHTAHPPLRAVPRRTAAPCAMQFGKLCSAHETWKRPHSPRQRAGLHSHAVSRTPRTLASAAGLGLLSPAARLRS